MIIHNETGNLYEQEDLAAYFWVKIHPEFKDCFNIPLSQLTALNYDEWISTMDSTDRVNQFFRDKWLPLVAAAHRTSEIVNLKKFIVNGLRAWAHIWIEYHNNDIHPYDGIALLHDSLVESFQHDNVVLVDPEPTHKPRITTTFEILQRAISNNFGKETGMLLITRTH